ncbi:diguanylate cyclase [Deinococcus detaillensis]|uniref:Diguanylate cyclase n=2 Tax=Deinococcus detaillensis TaxID=2592048 RepID=A0A553UZA2_9DEIO|nr:diguanylate cyclase [Deinococcus detaillensis]
MLVAALTNATNGIVISANVKGRPIVYCNPAFEQLTGYTRSEIVGHNCRFLQGEGTDPEAIHQMRTAFDAGAATELVVLNYKKSGMPFWNALNIGPIHNAQGTLTHFIGVQTDVTERIDLQKQLEQRAFTDVLTGLPNRAQFMHELERELGLVDRQGHLALGFVDLDDFKSVNDTYGHKAGDELLIQVAARLRGVVRGADLVARLAGDEFVLLLRQTASRDVLEQIGSRTLDTFQRPFVLDAATVTVHASLGFVQHVAGEHAAALLERADHCMYAAKHQGKNSFVTD